MPISVDESKKRDYLPVYEKRDTCPIFMPDVKQAIANGLARMLDPLIKMLIRYEITHREFADLAKRAYVKAAYRHFPIPNRKKTYSRVAVLTGLSRKEVVRIVNLEAAEVPVSSGPLNRAARVISGWLRDPDFLDERGEPRELPLRDAPLSFEALAARYSGDITGRAILDELLRVGAVSRPAKDRVKLVHHAYVPESGAPEKVEIVSTCVADLLETAVHNVEDDGGDPRFQRQVAYRHIPARYAEEFRAFSHARADALIREVDAWLAAKKALAGDEEGVQTRRVGLGVYYIENEEDQGGGMT